MKRVLVILLLAVLGSATSASESLGGEFTVKQCAGSGHSGFFGSYGSVNGETRVDHVSGCDNAELRKIGVYQDRSGQQLRSGGGGQFIWYAPDGVSVVGTAFTAKLLDTNGIRAALYGSNGTSVIDIDQGVAHDGNTRVSRWSDTGRPQSAVVAQITCHTSGPCSNQPNGPKAFIEVTDAEFTAADSSAPVAIPSGAFWDWGNDGSYHRSSASLQIIAGDVGSGLTSVWAEVNGLKVEYPRPGCPGDRGSYANRFIPCDGLYTNTKELDTSQAPFQEGSNQVRVCASDYADAPANANSACSPYRTILVDNLKPAAPMDLDVEGGSDWRVDNGFKLSWRNPPGQVAPVIGAIYSLWDTETNRQVDSGWLEGVDVSHAGPLEVPEPGEYRVHMYLVDAAYNLGQANDVVLRFDDRPPGNVSPEPAKGWVSDDELPLQQEIERAEAGGPSGVNGYALAVSSSGPEPPCREGLCLAPDLDLAGGPDLRTGSVSGLSEGSHWISAVAVSGALKPSEEPGNTMVRVDRTPPESTISGVPTEWVNHPVTVVVHSTDGLSGMKAEPGRDDGAPATFVDAEAYPTFESAGDTATFTLGSEGVNLIRYWAEDLAGNKNDGKVGPDGVVHPAPGRAVARIDLTEPSASFGVGGDPEDPERIELTATDADSGVAAAQVQIRKLGSDSEFRNLPTVQNGTGFEARVPSDDLPSGSYELRARVEDRAGNIGLADRRENGEPMVLALPLKEQTALTAQFKSRGTQTKARYGSRPILEGRLASNGVGLANQTLILTEKMAKGTRRESRTSSVRTDGDGRYRVKLSKGPSRTLSVSFPGSPRLGRASSPELSLRVKGLVRLKVKKGKIFNGATVKMSGRVGFAGALRPARGKLVAIQYFDPSRHKWRPVEVLRTRRNGKFTYRYRFQTISSAQRILFRAMSLPEAGWPYLPSTSRPRSVIVYPRK